MDFVQRDDMFAAARQAMEDGRFARALALLDQLVTDDENSVPFRATRAHALLLSGQGEEALSEATRAVDLGPRSTAALRVSSWASWQQGQLQQAQELLERWVDVARSHHDDEQLAEALAGYAEFLACERGPKLAENAARDAIAADERSSLAWAALGIAQLRLHQQQKAEESLQRALRLDPDQPRAQWGMLQLLQGRGDFPQAEALASFLLHQPLAGETIQKLQKAAKKQRSLSRLAAGKKVSGPGDDHDQLVRSGPDFRWEPIQLFVLAASLVGVIAVLVWMMPRYALPASLVAIGLSTLLVRAWWTR